MRTKSRGNGQGTAYKRGNTWTAQVVVGWKPADDPSKPPVSVKRSKGGFLTKKEALAYCPYLLAGSVARQEGAPRLSSYWDTYKTNKLLTLSKSKQTAYKIAWNRLKPLHDVHVDALTVQLIQTAINDSCSTFYPARDCKALLANLYKLIAAEGHANKDIPSLIQLPKLEETEQTPFSAEEQEALWKLYENGDMNACIPLLMIYTGMMPGEAQALRIDNIDLENRQIVGAGLKTAVRKKTPIVLAMCMLPVVRDLIANAQPNGYIWKQNEQQWYDAYYAALEAAGCRRLTPYSCRHTTATALAITKNIAPQTIKKIMRWSTTKMLDRYAHPETTDSLAAVDTIKTV